MFGHQSLIFFAIVFGLVLSVAQAPQLTLKLKRRIEIRMRQGLCAGGAKGHEEPCAGEIPI